MNFLIPLVYSHDPGNVFCQNQTMALTVTLISPNFHYRLHKYSRKLTNNRHRNHPPEMPVIMLSNGRVNQCHLLSVLPNNGKWARFEAHLSENLYSVL